MDNQTKKDITKIILAVIHLSALVILLHYYNKHPGAELPFIKPF